MQFKTIAKDEEKYRKLNRSKRKEKEKSNGAQSIAFSAQGRACEGSSHTRGVRNLKH